MYYSQEFCRSKIWSWVEKQEKMVESFMLDMRRRNEKNYFKVLQAFRELAIGDFHFQESTGYGYGDVGREALDLLYAKVFGAEAGLVRPQIVSGTHAISLCFFGLLRPGDEVLSITGSPYDSLHPVLGNGGSEDGSLKDWGIAHHVIPLNEDNSFDVAAIRQAINKNTKMIAIQRSKGYSTRPSIPIKEIEMIIELIKELDPKIICFVDNCYGEFVEEREPTQVGADIIAGSLIKNPGGGIAPAGGYIVGKAGLVEKISFRLTAPGLGAELGCSLAGKRPYYQGLFLAPLVVQEALQGAILAARIFSVLGFEVSPQWDEARTDIIQGINLNSRERLVSFCRGLQKGSPIDSYITPEPAAMPGYQAQIIMAGGTFIQGSSIELSGDAPLREPYTVFLQGGLAYPYVKAALLVVLEEMVEQNLITL